MEIQMDRKRGQGILKVSRLVNRMMNDYGHTQVILVDNSERTIVSVYEQVDEIIRKGSYTKEEQRFLNNLRKVVISYNNDWNDE